MEDNRRHLRLFTYIYKERHKDTATLCQMKFSKSVSNPNSFDYKNKAIIKQLKTID